MNNVLITGATGFLGRYLIEEFLTAGYNVIVQGRNKEKLEDLKNKYGVKTFECDLSDIHNRGLDVQYVVHAAAMSTVWGKYEDFYQTNVVGTRNVCEFCIKNRVKKLIHISSPSIYSGNKDNFDIKEKDFDKNNHLNFYIKTKIEAEDVVKDFRKQGLSICIIRPRALFGIGDTSIIPRLIKANRTIGIPLFNKGKNLVDITCVENVAYACRLALESNAAEGRAYNITNGEPRQFKEILEELFEKIGETPKYKALPLPLMYALATVLEGIYKLFKITKKEPAITKYTIITLGHSQTLNIDSAIRDFSYRPKLSLSEGIEKYANYVRQNPIH